MGLDAVEIVMEVEEAFDITLDDTEAMSARTPRDLIELVQAKVARVDPSVCQSQRAFQFVRHHLMQHRGLTRAQVTPAKRLDTFIARDQRQAFLRQLAADIGAGSPPPDLVRPPGVVKWVGAVAVAAGSLVGIAFGADWEGRFVFLLFATVVFAWIGALVTKPLRAAFPHDLTSIGDLAQWVRRHKPEFANCSRRAWDREEIATKIRAIVVATLGCEKHYHEDASFVRELGLS